MPTARAERRLWILGAAVLALLVAAAYLPCLHGAFIWDDDRYPGNPLLSLPGALAQIWIPGRTVQYYPATFLSFWLERRLWGLDPAGFHVVNWALHAANAFLAALCLRRLGWRGAWLAAAVFAVHPVHAESVAWLSERKNLLSGFFYLSAFFCFLRFEDDGGPRWYAAGLSAFALALLSKSTACTLPAALLIARWCRGRRLDETYLKSILPLFAVAGLAGATTAAMENANVGAAGAEFHLSLLQKTMLACREPFFYLEKLFWPANLSFSYERWSVAPRDLIAWPLAFAAAAGAAELAGRRWGRGVPAALAFFVVTLAPALSFVTVYTFRYSFVADHYQYLASLGPIALAAEWIWRSRWRWPGAVLAVLLLLPLTRARAGLYRTPDGVWRDAVLHSPRSSLARANDGFFLLKSGKPAEAAEEFREAIRLKPDFEDAHANLGAALLELGREDEAVTELETALAYQPDHVAAHTLLGRVLLRRGRYAEAAGHFLAVIRLRPSDASAYNDLGACLGALGRPAEAARAFEQALALRPDDAGARENLRLALKAASGSARMKSR